MDKIDEKIKNILELDINTSQNYNRKIKTALDSKENKFNAFIILKTVVTTCFCLIFMTGIGFAGYTAYEKIWKEPRKIEITKEFSEEEKAKFISEEKVESIATSYLEKIGLLDENVLASGLVKDYFSNENLWQIGTDKATLMIDAETGIIKSVNIPTWNYTIPYDYGITREEARSTAKELLEKYKTEDDKGEYKLVSLKRNMSPDENAYIWYADFEKVYGDLTNPYEKIHIGWVPKINGLYSLVIEREVFEENEQIITEEQAINIALGTDKKTETEKEIKSSRAGIRIKQMNPNVYIRENYKEEFESGKWNLKKIGDNSYTLKDDAIFFETEERVRKVWVVEIEYNVENYSSLSGFTYYIDATTGEVIGGELGIYILDKEESLYNDPHNVIEK